MHWSCHRDLNHIDFSSKNKDYMHMDIDYRREMGLNHIDFGEQKKQKQKKNKKKQMNYFFKSI